MRVQKRWKSFQYFWTNNRLQMAKKPAEQEGWLYCRKHEVWGEIKLGRWEALGIVRFRRGSNSQKTGLTETTVRTPTDSFTSPRFPSEAVQIPKSLGKADNRLYTSGLLVPAQSLWEQFTVCRFHHVRVNVAKVSLVLSFSQLWNSVLLP